MSDNYWKSGNFREDSIKTDIGRKNEDKCTLLSTKLIDDLNVILARINFNVLKNDMNYVCKCYSIKS